MQISVSFTWLRDIFPVIKTKYQHTHFILNEIVLTKLESSIWGDNVLCFMFYYPVTKISYCLDKDAKGGGGCWHIDKGPLLAYKHFSIFRKKQKKGFVRIEVQAASD